MRRLPVELQNKIIDFLISLPNIHDSEAQRALLYLSGLDTQLQAQIPIGMPPAQFIPSLIAILLDYGAMDDNRHALEAVLEATKQYVGQDRKIYCDTLVEELRALIKEHPRLNKRIKRMPATVRLATQRPIEEKELRNLHILRDKVKKFWIEGVLEKSIHNEIFLDLGKEVKTDVIDHPWGNVIELPGQEGQEILPDKRMIEIFDEAGHTLLILGEPGSGKTITLLELADELIARTEIDLSEPIPVIFNLSSWAEGKYSIVDWLESELTVKYQIPSKIGRHWLENYQVLPLLDGLDELKPQDRSECVEAINLFSEEIGLAGLVVCSRFEDYTSLPVQLKLNGAIGLKSLSHDQVDQYLMKAGPNLASLRSVLQTDHSLRELARNPLMLSIMSFTYQNTSPETLKNELDDSSENRRTNLFNNYIRKMFARRTATQSYPQQRTLKWLKWLAQKMLQTDQTMFMLEQIQPTWLLTNTQKWLYYLGIMIIVAFPISVFWGLSVGLPAHYCAPPAASVFGIGTGLAAGLAICLTLIQSFNILSSLAVGIAFGTAFGEAFKTVFGLSEWLSVGATVGIVTGLSFKLIGRRLAARQISNLYRIEIFEKVSWSWINALKGVFIGAIAGFLFGFITGRTMYSPIALNFGFGFSLSASLVGGVLNALRGIAVETKIRPNQGIWQSGRYAILIGIAISLMVGLPIGFTIKSSWEAFLVAFFSNFSVEDTLNMGVIPGVSIGIAIGLTVALFYGGLTFIQHFTIRLILYSRGYMPWRYAHFLDYAAEHIFLRKVGGGYIFVHRALLEHFATME
jgi:eukaryotic-like serine/threonine-protein kinase